MPNMIYLYSEAACLLMALVFLRRAPRHWRLLRPYLALVVAVEALGGVLAMGGKANHHLHNALLLVEGFVVAMVLYVLLRPYAPGRRLTVIWQGWLTAFLALYGVELIWLNHGRAFNTKTYSALALSVPWAAFYYNVRFAASPPAGTPWRDAALWWVNGTSAFYIGTLLVHLILPNLVHQPVRVWGLPLHFLVINANIVVLYGTWSYAFLCVYRRLN